MLQRKIAKVDRSIYRILKNLADSRSSPVHVWKVSKITRSTKPNDQYDILQFCKICKSTRHSTACKNDDSSWHIFMSFYTEQSKKYAASLCRRIFMAKANHGNRERSKLLKQEQAEERLKAEEMKNLRTQQIERSLKIIINTPRRAGKNNIPEIKRRNFAIYRLYRYCNLSPQKISHLTNFSLDIIKNIIADVFKYLCIADDKCIFKSVLMPEIKGV